MIDKPKKPINILIIENGTGPGGAFKCAINLAKALDKELFTPHIFMPKGWPDYQKLPSDIKILPIRQNIFRATKSNVKFVLDFFFGVLPFFVKTYIYCRKNNIKLIHLNNDLCTNYNGILASRLCGLPCISHTRGTSYDSKFMRFLANEVGLFITVSEYIKSDLMKLKIDEPKIKVIYDGYSTEEYNADNTADINDLKKELGIPQEARAVGITAMLYEWKGHKVFLRAAKEVISAIPESKFIIAGDTPTEDKKYKNELVSLSKELGIEKNVIFTGYRSDIYGIIKMLDIVVHASTSPDPLPGAVIQAMAMGKAVVAANCGGVPEIIKDGDNGILFEPGNVEQLKDAILDLLKNKEKRENIGTNARKTFEEKFRVDRMIKEIEKVYSYVVNHR